MNNLIYKWTALVGIILMMGCFSTTLAQADRPERPELIEFSDLNPIQVPEVHRFTYRGIQFFLVEDPELPLISLTTRIKAGSWLEPEEKNGLASMTGTVMRSGGTVNYPADKLNELLENNAVSMETSFGLTSGTASMNLLKEDFDEMLPVFIELLTKPAFPEDKFELAKTQNRSGISRRNDNPSGIASREFNNLLYDKQSVYSRTLEYHHLDNIELQDLIDFHKNAVVSENLMVGVIGDFNVRDMRNKLERAFRNIPSGNGNEFNFPEIDYDFESTINFVDRSDMNQSIIRIGHIGGFRDNPDYAALQVMNQILSGGFSGRLMQEVRTRLGLAYGVSGSYTSNVLYPGVFFAGLSTASESTAEAIKATLNELKRLQNEEVPQQELDDTRERFLNSLVFRYENRASALNEQLNNTYLGLPLDAFEQYVEDVKNVTVQDIQRVAREYLQPDKTHILVVGNSELIGDQLEEFGTVNEIDITIPRPEVVTDDASAEAGAEWIGKMKNALIGDQSFSKIGYTGSVQQGGMNVGVEINYTFPDKLEQIISTPTGAQTVLFENGNAKMMAGGQEQQFPPAVAEIFKLTLDAHYMNIALHSSDFTAVYQGEEEAEGVEVVKIFLAEPEITIYISKESSLPVKTSFGHYMEQMGGDVTFEFLYDNWNETNGITAAWSETQKLNGQPQGVFTFESHTVE